MFSLFLNLTYINKAKYTIIASRNVIFIELEFSGTGNKISYQSPEAGTRVLEGTSIRLLLTE